MSSATSRQFSSQSCLRGMNRSRTRRNGIGARTKNETRSSGSIQRVVNALAVRIVHPKTKAGCGSDHGDKSGDRCSIGCLNLKKCDAGSMVRRETAVNSRRVAARGAALAAQRDLRELSACCCRGRRRGVGADCRPCRRPHLEFGEPGIGKTDRREGQGWSGRRAGTQRDMTVWFRVAHAAAAAPVCSLVHVNREVSPPRAASCPARSR